MRTAANHTAALRVFLRQDAEACVCARRSAVSGTGRAVCRVPSQEEAIALSQMHHCAMLETLYSTGTAPLSCASSKSKYIDSHRMVIQTARARAAKVATCR